MGIVAAVVPSGNPFDPPTNRGRNTPDSGVPLIDTVKVEDLISEHRLPRWLSRHQVNEHGEFSDDFVIGRRTLGSGVRLRVRRQRQGSHFAALEFSVPTVATGHNLAPANVDLTLATIKSVYEEAAEWVQWARPPEDLAVTRLDLDRDFQGVKHPDHLLSGLARVRVPRTANPSVFHDADRGGALTLTRAPKTQSWRASLYGKHAQMMHLASAEKNPQRSDWLRHLADQSRDVLRFETQLWTRALRPAGITTISDLHEENLMHLRKKHFDKAKFGTCVGGPAKWDELVLRLAEEGSNDRNYLGPVWQMLYEESLGLKPKISDTTRAKYRAFAKDWEISAADFRSSVGTDIGLDFDLAELVVGEGEAA
jgi:hypothetical protein